MAIYKIGNKLLSNGAGKMYGFTVPEPQPHRSSIGPEQSEYSNVNIPTDTAWTYSITQQIYEASEINFEGNITGIVFFTATTSTNRTIKIYMTSTELIQFNNKSSIPVTESDCVFGPGSISLVKDQPIIINLDKPFYYDGINNLLLTVIDSTGSSDYTYTYFYTLNTSSTLKSLYNAQNSRVYDATVVNTGLVDPKTRNSVQILFNGAEYQSQ